MDAPGTTAEVRQALEELIEYLCDRSVPLMVAEAVETLLEQPPELTAEAVGTWVANQRDVRAGAARVSDYLHHAVKKIALLSEFNLLEMDRLRPFLVGLAERLDAYCPPHEREAFVAGLRAIGRSEGGSRSSVSVLYRAPESLGAGTGPPASPAAAWGAPGVAMVPGVPYVPAGVPLGMAVPVPAAAGAQALPAPGLAAPAGAAGPPSPGAVAGAPAAVLVAPAAGSEAVLAESLQRFALLLERLTSLQGASALAAAPAAVPGGPSAAAAAFAPGPAGAGPATTAAAPAADPSGPPAAKAVIVSEALKAAALGARSPGELDLALKQLAGLGVDASMQQVVRGLAATLPQWLVETPDEAPADDPRSNRAMAALHKIVATAPDPPEAGRRFFELLSHAVELFNQGDLGRALAASRVVRRLMRAREIPADSADLMLRRAAGMISAERLQAVASDPLKQPHVRRFLEVFPSLSPEVLLGLLAEEPDRQRRKILLATVEAYGAPARGAVASMLGEVQRGEVSDPHGFVQRNLVYLLRRLPTSEDGWRDEEIELVRVASDLGRPLLVAREAVRALARIPHEKATRLLVQRLGQLERVLIESPRTLPYRAADGVALLDRLVEGLARHGNAAAVRAVELHTRRKESALGPCLRRVELLHTVDLAVDPGTVQRILERIREALPSRLAALALGGKSERITPLVVALSSTRTRDALELMEALAQRFPAEPYGAAAQAILEQRTVAAARPAGDQDDLTANPGAPSAPAAGGPAAPRAGAPAGPPATPAAAGAAAATQRTISGDLDIFGLPSLLQSFALSKLSGTLVLSDPAGQPCAQLVLDRGALERCAIAHLSAESALFQIFESGVTGTFEFTGAQAPPADLATAAPDVTGLIFEALRRTDELQLLRALVPDAAALRPTGVKPTVVPDEDDTALMRQVWGLVAAGRRPLEVEAHVGVDSYRVRRVLAHWIEKGALAVG